MDHNIVISVEKLSIDYATVQGTLPAVRDVSFTIKRGETLGLVGESGSGKSSIAFALMKYFPKNGRISEGRIVFLGEEMLQKTPGELRHLWGKNIAMVYQDPMSSLNPSLTVGFQIAEILSNHQNIDRKTAWQRTLEILERVKIPDPESSAHKFPHQMSGGQQQRVIIAMALCCNPDLLIMDEPTTSLDVTTEATILDLIKELKTKFNSAILFISHNLGVIAKVADKIVVLYAGQMVETGKTRDVFENPLHPYTMALMDCIPSIVEGKDRGFKPIPGVFPDLTCLHQGCIFYPRCLYMEEKCKEKIVPLTRIHGDRGTACLRWNELRQLEGQEKVGETLREVPYEAIRPIVKSEGNHLIMIDHLKKYYGFSASFSSLFGGGKHYTRAIDDVSLSIRHGEVFGIVGESGCGKSTLGWIICKLFKPTEGKVFYQGKDLWQLSESENRIFHQLCQIVLQNPDSSLNPRKTVEKIIERPLILFNYGTLRQRKQRIAELLDMVRMEARFTKLYPHELSGGEKQRIAIARAFGAEPNVIICDEPLSALDVSVQASILNLLIELRNRFNASYLFISHDLSVVKHISDSICVMYLGKICEVGTAEEIFSPPYHPYTLALLSAVPRVKTDPKEGVIRLEGAVPSAKDPPSGCRFHTRCPEKIGEICENEEAKGISISASHSIYCHLFG